MDTAFPAIVYILCFLTSAACAALLARNYRRTGARLLMWSSACFVLLALNNLVVVFDLMIYIEPDLRALRTLLSLAAVSILLFGFIWEAEQ